LYDSIYTAWKREKDSEEIQPLPKDFFQKASEYLSELKSSLGEQSKESATRSAKERETEYVEFMLLGLLKMRARKMLSLPLTDLELSPNFLENELALIDDLHKGLKKYLEKPILQPANPEMTEKNHLGGEALATTFEKNPSDFMLLRMLQPIPRLVGVDLDEYGPFQPEDLVTLPRENALALIARGVALEVKPSSYQETGGSES
jgi:DNA replication initiation complex subunit (GINS family)